MLRDNDDPLIETGQGRTDADMESAMYGGSVAFTGMILAIIAAIVWCCLLSGCNSWTRGLPGQSESELRKVVR